MLAREKGTHTQVISPDFSHLKVTRSSLKKEENEEKGKTSLGRERERGLQGISFSLFCHTTLECQGGSSLN